MSIKKMTICPCRTVELAARNAGHDLTEHGGMIFRLNFIFGADDTHAREIVAQPRQRTLVQKTGEVVRGVRQQFAAADADE